MWRNEVYNMSVGHHKPDCDVESKIKAFQEGHEEWKRMKEHLRQQKQQSNFFTSKRTIVATKTLHATTN